MCIIGTRRQKSPRHKFVHALIISSEVGSEFGGMNGRMRLVIVLALTRPTKGAIQEAAKEGKACAQNLQLRE